MKKKLYSKKNMMTLKSPMNAYGFGLKGTLIKNEAYK